MKNKVKERMKKRMKHRRMNKIIKIEQGRIIITKGVSTAYREGGNNYSNFLKYTYQIKGKETEANSTLLQDKEEH